ncbi:MAG TPA: glycosyltransferase family 2 protein [Rhodoblastus sp.]|nr:glycosyltransferase family 2 protein [Rhodoblastus sp.]
MSAAITKPLELRPLRDVAIEDGCFVALGPEPWLEVGPLARFRRGATIEICYAAGLTDRISRPVLQFRDRSGRAWNALLPAPSEGAGFWRGRVPRDTVEIRISPTDEPGPFRFTIESVRVLSPREMMRLRIASPRRGLFATGARMARLHEEADLNLRWMLERAETQNFDHWRARRSRPGPIAEISPSQVAVAIRGADDVAGIARAAAALLAQTHARWRLALPDASPEVAAWAQAQADPRIAAGTLEDAAFVMPLDAGDRLVPHALSAFLAKFARHPGYEIVYSDETRRPRPGVAAEAVFKPDWSPTRQAYSPYVGRAAMLRGPVARRLLATGRASDTPQALVDAALGEAAPGAVGHVARALVETAGPAPLRPRMDRRAPPANAARRKVTIIIPTRDRIRLLERCLDSILARTRYGDYDVMVIDNGSVQPMTLASLDRYARIEPRISVLRNPMPFNFGALCNFGVAHARGDTIVFLNNDTVILQRDWIERMLEFAVRPDVGAVGCKLVYPNGRVQHSGVVLGLGGVAGHFGDGIGRRARGWLGGSLGPHETSAVTAACLMVERDKFETVQGFDEKNLPIELNDVDLCLRLDARGWRTICDCRVIVAHHESASRGGATLRLQRVYRKEREYFAATWGGAIRSDRYFNPNLSLYDREPKLG